MWASTRGGCSLKYVAADPVKCVRSTPVDLVRSARSAPNPWHMGPQSPARGWSRPRSNQDVMQESQYAFAYRYSPLIVSIPMPRLQVLAWDLESVRGRKCRGRAPVDASGSRHISGTVFDMISVPQRHRPEIPGVLFSSREPLLRCTSSVAKCLTAAHVGMLKSDRYAHHTFEGEGVKRASGSCQNVG